MNGSNKNNNNSKDKVCKSEPVIKSSSVDEDEINKIAKKIVSDQEGVEVKPSKEYGVGADVHKLFIEICVIIKYLGLYKIFTYRSDTDYQSLLIAKQWIIEILRSQPDPKINITDSFHYVIESTSTYHMPVVRAWEGIPSIINPALAGPSRRKTDKLDAQSLCVQDLINIWNESYVPSSGIYDLRTLLYQHDRYQRIKTSTSNRINTDLMKFGFNIGREGSVTGDPKIRATIESVISGQAPVNPTDFPGLPPYPIPSSTCKVIAEQFKLYDQCSECANKYINLSVEQAYLMEWPIKDGKKVLGKDLIPILETAPGIGSLKAVTWLAFIMDPCRFPNKKAVTAYCGLDPSLKVSAGKVTSTKKRKGNMALHSTLTQAASILISKRTEWFGRWGYNLFQRSGSKKKAINAVARRLAIALYNMNLNMEPFSYDKYEGAKEVKVFCIPIEDFNSMTKGFNRYMPILSSMGITNTKELVSAYYACSFKDKKGLGKKFYCIINDFIMKQDEYKKSYHLLQHSSSDKKEGAT